MNIYTPTRLLLGLWYIWMLQLTPCVAADTLGIVWGSSTNGLRLGVKISSADILPKPAPNCLIYVENVGTNFLYLRLPEAGSRYRAHLQTDGLTVTRTDVPLSPATRTRWVGVSTNAPVQVDYFSLPECFQIRTNGTYSVGLSLKLASSPVAADVWGRKAKYFWLPPVTNQVQITNLAVRN
jgi:hypothetical protein